MKKRILIFLILLLLIGSIIGIGVFRANYILIDGKITDRDAAVVVLTGEELPDAATLQGMRGLQVLDLRNLDVEIGEYEALRQQLPDCEILWLVPFQGNRWDNAVAEISVTSMDNDTVGLLEYFPNLQTVDACGCTDYDALMKLAEERLDLTVKYTLDVGYGLLREDATECTITDENAELVLEAVAYLPQLKVVNGEDCSDYDALMELCRMCPELVVNYTVTIGHVPQAGDASVLTLDIADAPEAMELLQYFTNLTNVVFTGLAENRELMYQMMCRYPDVVIEWAFELYGVETRSTAAELYLNEIPMESVAVVEDALKYFYDLQWVEMCQCGIPSEEMDALWKRHPETRFVWAIPMANFYVRTDVTAFIPYKYGYDINRPFYDPQAKELKYLVDLECLDLGHMRMTDISFLQYMPKLRFLILADTVCKDFSYLADLTELVYLELFRSEIKDVNLLMNLTKLEDLNIGWTSLDNPELLKEMTWLKRLWTNLNGMNRAELEDLRDSMPNTLVYIDSNHPTDGGWRQSDRYYEMRDMLGMFYMK